MDQNRIQIGSKSDHIDQKCEKMVEKVENMQNENVTSRKWT